MKQTLPILVAIGFLLSTFCACEPPRVYHDSMVLSEEWVTTPPVPPIVVAPPLSPSNSAPPDPCAALSCEGDLSISGMMTASSFREGRPLLLDAVAELPYQFPINATTLLVYPNGDTTALALPCAATIPGRIVRVKAMGVGVVDIHGTFNQDTGLLDTIDEQPFYSMQSMLGASYPAVTLQAYYENSADPPSVPHRTGWAVLSQ